MGHNLNTLSRYCVHPPRPASNNDLPPWPGPTRGPQSLAPGVGVGVGVGWVGKRRVPTGPERPPARYRRLERKPTRPAAGLPGPPWPSKPPFFPHSRLEPSPGSPEIQENTTLNAPTRRKAHMLQTNFRSSRGASGADPIGQTTCHSQGASISLARL